MKLSYKKFHVCEIKACYILTRTGPLCRLHQYKLDRYGDAEYVRPKKKFKLRK